MYRDIKEPSLKDSVIEAFLWYAMVLVSGSFVVGIFSLMGWL